MALKTMLLQLLARAGVRLALVQSAIVLIAFLLAGYLTQISLERISEASIRTHVAGEAASLDAEFVQKGAAHLPFTVAKRSRLWRGFDYRLAASDGRLLAGRLLNTASAFGWGDLRVSRPGAPDHRYLSYTKLMPDGARLTVAQDTAVEAGEMAAIRRTLLLCGALGVIFCVGVSHLFARGTWRRIGAVSTVAHAVSGGRLDVRVSAHSGPPRDDVDALANTFNRMLDHIGLLVAQVRQVSVDIAHDLRTPLTRFKHKLEVLRAKAAGDLDLLRAVSGLEADVDEIIRTFDALLQLSEIEAVDRSRSTSVTDLEEMAKRVVEAYRPDIEDSGRTLDVRTRRTLVEGEGDLLAQGLANLLENALRHTPKGSRILVSVSEDLTGAKLAVEDDGPGIPVENRPRAVQPFVRLEPSRNAPGSGLGLAIVAAVAARHDGALSLEDAGPGLRAIVKLKRFSDGSTHDAAPKSQNPPPSLDRERLETPKGLIDNYSPARERIKV